jgi:hypothetical protein
MRLKAERKRQDASAPMMKRCALYCRVGNALPSVP